MYNVFLIPDNYQILYILYIIAWIFIGNYTLLNLFLAILLDGNLNLMQGLELKTMLIKMIYWITLSKNYYLNNIIIYNYIHFKE